MAIKTSANVPSKGGKTGNYDRVGQSPVSSRTVIKTNSNPHKAGGRDSFYGGKPSSKRVIKTTSNC